MRIVYIIFVGISSAILFSCTKKTTITNPAFTFINATTAGINFSNTLTPKASFNMLSYMYFYNGAGVASGDFNNDGKIDLFFASNQGQNSMYINEGSMHFKDVTKEAKIPNDSAWSTGVSVLDINNDGMLDLYVCRVSNYKNIDR